MIPFDATGRARVAACAALLLGGCSPFASGIWLVHMPVLDPECEVTYTENFNEADPPQEEEATQDWILTTETEASDELVHMQILYGRNNEVFLMLGGGGPDLTYPGVEEEGVLKFSWETTNVTTELKQHDSGYLYREKINASVLNTVTFTKNTDSRGLDGTWEVDTETVLEFEETDEWGEGVGLPTGEISIAVDTYLVGTFPLGAANQSGRADCGGATCWLAVTTECNARDTFTAQDAGFKDEDSFDYAEEYGQPAGG